MITNDRQYRISKAALRGFREALATARQETDVEDPILHESFIGSLQSDINTLRAQVQQYDAIRSGKVQEFETDFDSLGEVLALARVASGLKQRELAEHVGIQPQQIQRYEAAEYEQASYARLKEIVWALNLRISLQVWIGAAAAQERALPSVTLEEVVLPGVKVEALLPSEYRVSSALRGRDLPGAVMGPAHIQSSGPSEVSWKYHA